MSIKYINRKTLNNTFIKKAIIAIIKM